MNPLRWKLHWQILLSLGLALILGGVLLPTLGENASTAVIAFSRFLGKLFMNALKMVIVPLIVASIISGVMHLGAEKGVGRMGLKTFLYYTFSGAAAVIIGLIMVNVIGPGRIDAATATAMLGTGAETSIEQASWGSRGKELERSLRDFPAHVPVQRCRCGDQ